MRLSQSKRNPQLVRMWTHPAKRFLQSEITCSSPFTVRFIFYALNPSVLIVCVTSVAKSCVVFVIPPPPPKKKPGES